MSHHHIAFFYTGEFKKEGKKLGGKKKKKKKKSHIQMRVLKINRYLVLISAGPDQAAISVLAHGAAVSAC